MRSASNVWTVTTMNEGTKKKLCKKWQNITSTYTQKKNDVFEIESFFVLDEKKKEFT